MKTFFLSYPPLTDCLKMMGLRETPDNEKLFKTGTCMSFFVSARIAQLRGLIEYQQSRYFDCDNKEYRIRMLTDTVSFAQSIQRGGLRDRTGGSMTDNIRNGMINLSGFYVADLHTFPEVCVHGIDVENFNGWNLKHHTISRDRFYFLNRQINLV